MKWINVNDALPTEYQIWYLVLAQAPCDKCDKEEDHSHKLNFTRFRYSVAFWSPKDMHLVEWYRAKGDNSWDHWTNDHFTMSPLMHSEITHWMPFPNYPE